MPTINKKKISEEAQAAVEKARKALGNINRHEADLRKKKKSES